MLPVEVQRPYTAHITVSVTAKNAFVHLPSGDYNTPYFTHVSLSSGCMDICMNRRGQHLFVALRDRCNITFSPHDFDQRIPSRCTSVHSLSQHSFQTCENDRCPAQRTFNNPAAAPTRNTLPSAISVILQKAVVDSTIFPPALTPREPLATLLQRCALHRRAYARQQVGNGCNRWRPPSLYNARLSQ